MDAVLGTELEEAKPGGRGAGEAAETDTHALTASTPCLELKASGLATLSTGRKKGALGPEGPEGITKLGAGE